MPAAAWIPGAIQGVIGGIQTLFGGGRANKAQNEMEKMIRNYKGSESIQDYYTKALNKYNMNPYNSAMYQLQSENARSGTAQGINALQDRRSALGGVSSLVANQNNNLLKAAAAAEGQQAQALGQLGQATAMKDREDKYKFEAKYNLLGAKAGGGGNIMNAGLSNLYGGIGNISDYAMVNRMYGNGGEGTANSSNSGGGYSDGISIGDLQKYNRTRKY